MSTQTETEKKHAIAQNSPLGHSQIYQASLSSTGFRDERESWCSCARCCLNRKQERQALCFPKIYQKLKCPLVMFIPTEVTARPCTEKHSHSSAGPRFRPWCWQVSSLLSVPERLGKDTVRGRCFHRETDLCGRFRHNYRFFKFFLSNQSRRQIELVWWLGNNPKWGMHVGHDDLLVALTSMKLHNKHTVHGFTKKTFYYLTEKCF